MSDRVVLLAVDGLDWSRLREGVAAGRLPEFGRFLGKGGHAEVAVAPSIPGLAGAEEGMNSPTLWTTVATGQYYFQHGVYDFCNAMESIESPPLFESRHVRSPRIWDVLTHAEIPSLVLGYYVTHPAYPIKGVMVSDLFGEVVGESAVWPPERRDELARVLGANDYSAYLASNRIMGTEACVGEAGASPTDRKAAHGQAAEVLRQFAQLEAGEIEALLDTNEQPLRRQMLEHRLVYPVIRDRRFHRLLLELMEKETWRFATVYYRLIDFVSHGFWPEGSDLPDDFRRRYGEVVDRAYAQADEWIGQVRAKLDPNDRLMILSDHGFTAATATKGLDQCQDAWEINYGQHAEPAVLLVAGGPKSGRFDEVTLLDVAPTVLDFLGLAQAETFDGGAVPGLLCKEAPRDLAPVDSYPYSPPKVESGITDREQDMVMKRLAALGYVE